MAAAAERCSRDPCGALCPLLAYLSVGYADYAVLAHVLPQPALRARCQREEPGLWGALFWGQRGLWRGVGSAGAPGPPQLRGSLGGSALRDPPVGCGDALGAAMGSSGSWGPHGVQGSLLDPRGPVAVVSARGSGSVGHRVYGVSVGLWALCLWDPRGCMGFAGLWDPRSDPGPWGSDCAGALRGSGCWGSPCAPHPSAHGAPSTQ